MDTRSDKSKLWIFMGCLFVMALVINFFFYSQSRSSKAAAAQKLLDEAAAIARQETEVTEAAARIAAARMASERVVAEHAAFLRRYLNAGTARKPGVEIVAVAVSSETGELNRAVGTALALHLKTPVVETLSSFFKGEFVSSGLINDAFNDSGMTFRKLELAKTLDGLLLGRQQVQYSTNPELLNVVTANMQLELELIPLAGNAQSESWTFAANGAGFNRQNARQLAEERLIKQIETDTKMSVK
jgi:hypothetical protein